MVQNISGHIYTETATDIVIYVNKQHSIKPNEMDRQPEYM